MNKYRKLVVAIVGLAAIVLNDFFGISALAGVQEPIINLAIAGLTAIGVERIANA